MSKIRSYENLHIPLWLIKDTCWMMQLKTLGIIMIVPTITVAIYLTIKTAKEKNDEYLINLAICFWVIANSYWMICEFIEREDLKNYAGISFIAGMISVIFYYIKHKAQKKMP